MSGLFDLFAVWTGLTVGGILGTALAVYLIMRRGERR